jgi:hypothetical protein
LRECLIKYTQGLFLYLFNPVFHMEELATKLPAFNTVIVTSWPVAIPTELFRLLCRSCENFNVTCFSFFLFFTYIRDDCLSTFPPNPLFFRTRDFLFWNVDSGLRLNLFYYIWKSFISRFTYRASITSKHVTIDARITCILVRCKIRIYLKNVLVKTIHGIRQVLGDISSP